MGWAETLVPGERFLEHVFMGQWAWNLNLCWTQVSVCLALCCELLNAECRYPTESLWQEGEFNVQLDRSAG